MNVVKKLTLDLMRKGVPQAVELVQGDSAVALSCTLLCDGSPWVIPPNASVLLRYQNGQAGGEYDTLPGGKIAYAISGNTLTVYLAPAVCSMAGKTDFQIVICAGAAQKSTLRIALSVQGEVVGAQEPQSYTNLTQWLLENSSTVPENSLAALRQDMDTLTADAEMVIADFEARISALETMPVYSGEMEDV